jgi:hypothetical protein
VQPRPQRAETAIRNQNHRDAVDFANGIIRVESSMNSYGELSDPKSRAGRRAVPIVAAPGRASRRSSRAHQPRRRLRLRFRSPDAVHAVEHPALGQYRVGSRRPEADRPPRVPHTFANILIAAGVNARAITA